MQGNPFRPWSSAVDVPRAPVRPVPAQSDLTREVGSDPTRGSAPQPTRQFRQSTAGCSSAGTSVAETTGALVVATLAFVVALLTYATRTYFDHVDAWWKRTQWALHKALSDDELVAVVGLDAALVLVRARVPKRDRQVLQRAIVQIATGV